MRLTAILITAGWIAAATAATAQSNQPADPNPSKAWADCLTRQNKLGASSREDASIVVDHAFAECASAEQRLARGLIAQRVAASESQQSEQAITAAVASALDALKKERRADFVAGVQDLRRQNAQASSPYGDPELDALRARNEKTLLDPVGEDQDLQRELQKN